MNFSRMIKDELAGKEHPSACCKVACLSAFLRTSGEIVTRGGNVGFSFSTENERTAEYFNGIVNHLFSIEGSLKKSTGGGRPTYTAEFIGSRTAGILAELGILTFSPEGVSVCTGIDKYLVESECCKRAYVAGAFLGGGSCTIPSEEGGGTTGYHLEFVFSYYETAHAFAELLAEFDILAKLTERKGSFVVYLKNNEEIQEILSITGADESSHFLAETVVRKDVNNNVNRKTNCDLGNISKQIEASEKQQKAILALDRVIGISSLPPELRAACELRLGDPTLTLGEMAEKLGVSKSCINHRMRKIVKLARDLS